MIWETPEELDMELAKRFQKIRKSRGITQEELAVKSNVSFGSIKRFETTGNISLISLTKLCTALHMEGELRALFSKPVYKSIEEIINER